MDSGYSETALNCYLIEVNWLIQDLGDPPVLDLLAGDNLWAGVKGGGGEIGPWGHDWPLIVCFCVRCQSSSVAERVLALGTLKTKYLALKRAEQPLHT